MTKDPVVCTTETALREAVGLMKKHHIGGLPVLEGSELVGMLTESDLISLLESERISDDLWLPSPFEIIEIPIREYINWEKTKHALRNIGDMKAKKVMTRRVITATEEYGYRSSCRADAQRGNCASAGDAEEKTGRDSRRGRILLMQWDHHILAKRELIPEMTFRSICAVKGVKTYGMKEGKFGSGTYQGKRNGSRCIYRKPCQSSPY